jgi:hypothetical protein
MTWAGEQEESVEQSRDLLDKNRITRPTRPDERAATAALYLKFHQYGWGPFAVIFPSPRMAREASSCRHFSLRQIHRTGGRSLLGLR